ncbi:unnamed protein product [Leptosia nina]|uniref:Uncharacterized protein n=1 Tax=Leptosia nina TaxID=320188 RepID=A0AAV1J3N1_9NEOP
MAPALVTFAKFCLGQDTTYLLPFGFVLPFDPLNHWVRYIAVYSFQVYSMFHFVYVFIGTQTLMVTLCAFLTAEFGLLQHDFVHVNLEPEQNHSTIKDCVRKHQLLLSYTDMFNDIFNKMLFIDLLFVSLTVAKGILELVNNFVAVIALLLPTLIFCYYGEQLKEESAGIADSAYNSKWNIANLKYRKSIIFIIKRAQKPSCLMSLGYVPVTLHTFSRVVSTAWSYFSLIRSVYKDI